MQGGRDLDTTTSFSCSSGTAHLILGLHWSPDQRTPLHQDAKDLQTILMEPVLPILITPAPISCVSLFPLRGELANHSSGAPDGIQDDSRCNCIAQRSLSPAYAHQRPKYAPGSKSADEVFSRSVQVIDQRCHS